MSIRMVRATIKADKAAVTELTPVGSYRLF